MKVRFLRSTEIRTENRTGFYTAGMRADLDEKLARALLSVGAVCNVDEYERRAQEPERRERRG